PLLGAASPEATVVVPMSSGNATGLLRLPSGKTVPIAADRAEIGRGITNTEEAAAIDLTGEQYNETVSRIHALITHAGGRFEIEDLRSANGTVLNGQKLIPGQRYPLQNGDMVEFGKVRSVFGRG
ncbi:MAG: FHA domain-containing protein, partial [Ktedonobacterales bacterium]